MRVAILETDTPADTVAEKLGSYGDIFTRLLRDSGLGDEHTIETYDVVSKMEYPDPEGLDAILLTGSKFTVYHNDEWIVKLVDFTKDAVARGVKVIGICFGHQILARALGAKTGKNPAGWEVASTPIKLTDTGKKVLPTLGDTVNIMQMHQDYVAELPDGAELLCENEICRNQGFYKPGSYITFQGHPEFDTFIVTEIVRLRQKLGVFPDDVANAYIKRSRGPNDGPAISKALVQFLLS